MYATRICDQSMNDILLDIAIVTTRIVIRFLKRCHSLIIFNYIENYHYQLYHYLRKMCYFISCEEASSAEDPVLVTTGENTLTWRRCVSRVAALLVVLAQGDLQEEGPHQLQGDLHCSTLCRAPAAPPPPPPAGGCRWSPL